MKECVSLVFWPSTGSGNTVPVIGDKLMVLGSNDKLLLSGIVVRVRTTSPSSLGSDVCFYIGLLNGRYWRHWVKLKTEADVALADSYHVPLVESTPVRETEHPDDTIARATHEGEQFREWMADRSANRPSWREWIAARPYKSA